MPDYRVQTDIYNGPMDLLLYLIRREEVDIYDIPISRVTQQYLDYVTTLKSIDPNIAGEFLVLAATLMEIKSRMLLPRPPAETGEEEDLSDPRLELVRQLLEYKKYKDASLELAAAAHEAAMRWPRLPGRMEKESPGVVDLDDVQIWDLVAVFNKLMASIGARSATHDVVFDDTPIALHAADILDRIQSEGGELTFEGIFMGRTKVEMIGLFLALLELMRQRRVKVSQSGPFAAIRITLLSAEPIEIGDEWTPAIHDAVLGPTRDDAADEIESIPAAPTIALDEDEEEERFDDLDKIKTDVDIDAILHEAAPPEEKPE
ncbi:MAG: segregation/condensation protein A [Planctomycetes bacterium]|nr:segregation/condensation protein A [Planctomycetota bacterium]